MNPKKTNKSSAPKSNKRIAHEAEGVASGALAGAALGAAGGPPGAVAGAIIGGIAGALAGAALDTEASEESTRSRELDEQIGVFGGTLGAPKLAHPPAKIGAYSAGSAGTRSSSDDAPAEGPIPSPEK